MAVPPFRTRPGRLADVPSIARLYALGFDKDSLLDVLFPLRRNHHPDDVRTFAHRMFLDRAWNPLYVLSIAETVPSAEGEPQAVGFTWWRRPESELSFYERWVSPSSWIHALVKVYLSVLEKVFPLPGTQSPNDGINAFFRVMHEVEPAVLTTPRRREAWYLSTLVVDPAVQGNGVGGLLLRHGFDLPSTYRGREKGAGTASWLVGVYGSERFYSRFGFVEVARANVGPMAGWDGGAIMFRE